MDGPREEQHYRGHVDDEEGVDGGEDAAGDDLSASDDPPADNDLLAGDDLPADNDLLAGDDLPADNDLLAGDDLPADDDLLAGDDLPADDDLLAAYDEQVAKNAVDEGSEDSLRFDRWRRRSAVGAMMTGVAFGLQEALGKQREEPAIVLEAAGDPSGPDNPIELQFDPDHPEKTVAVIRPWLMNREEPPHDGSAE